MSDSESKTVNGGSDDVKNAPENPGWIRASAIPLLQDLEDILAAVGFHVGLGGSVLHKGESKKDLDILVMPRLVFKNRVDFTPAREALEKHFGKKLTDCVSTPEKPRDHKYVSWLRDYRNRRIDFFFLS